MQDYSIISSLAVSNLPLNPVCLISSSIKSLKNKPGAMSFKLELDTDNPEFFYVESSRYTVNQANSSTDRHPSG